MFLISVKRSDYFNFYRSISLMLLFMYAGGGVFRNSIQSPGWKLQLVRGIGNNGGRATNVDWHRTEYREPREKPRTSQQQLDQREKKRLLAYSRENIEKRHLTKGYLFVNYRETSRYPKAVSSTWIDIVL